MLSPVTIKKTKAGIKPRSNVKTNPKYTSYEIYRALPDDIKISYTEYKRYMDAFNIYLFRMLMYTGVRLYMPFFLGSLGIIRRKPKHGMRSMDVNVWNKYKIRVPYKNFHSEGQYARFDWCKKRDKYRGSTIKHMLSFKPNQQHSKAMGRAILNSNTLYKYELARY